MIALREHGECVFELPELLFDQDYPGHYARKVKFVSVSLAGVSDAENVRATLTQLSSQVLLKPDIGAVRYLLGMPDPGTFDAGTLRSNWWVNQQVALSRTVDDSGLFYLNFFDSRYFPFEGTGAVSSWKLSIPQAANRFDIAALDDVGVSLRYTALDGGPQFGTAVRALEPVRSYAGAKLFVVTKEFPAQWQAFVGDHTDPSAQTLSFPITDSLIPWGVEDGEVVGVFVQLVGDVDAASPTPYLSLTVPGAAPVELTVGNANAAVAALVSKTFGGTWALRFALGSTPAALKKDGFIDPQVLHDILIVVYYKGRVSWNAA